jgi:hypothetical protein
MSPCPSVWKSLGVNWKKPKSPGWLGDPQGRVIRIGFAGGRSLFGLRGELANELKRRAGQKVRFRLEITSQYLSRFEELLMIHKADHGELPPGNESDRGRRLGRLHPS